MAYSEFSPFTNLAPPFSIGLKPVNPSSFLHCDDDIDRYLEEKRDLYARQFHDVFMEEPDTRPAQEEVVQLIERDCGKRIGQTNLPPLAEAALHVQDDLVIMRKDGEAWRLVAASLCFPSSWNLAEKFGLPMEQIHAPVPYMAEKISARINRIFNALKPETPLWRENWSIDADADLRHDRKERARTGYHKLEALDGETFLRCEYQTLHKLPQSGDILFTIKIVVKSVAELSTTSAGRRVLLQLADQIAEMGDPGRSYKGLLAKADLFTEQLRDIATPSEA